MNDFSLSAVFCHTKNDSERRGTVRDRKTDTQNKRDKKKGRQWRIDTEGQRHSEEVRQKDRETED